MKDVVIVGAGLTGLTLAFLLKEQGKNILLVEKSDRIGGVIRTHDEKGYVFEEGPNTGVVSRPEVRELFELLQLKIEAANKSAAKRLILKDKTWHPLPHCPGSFLKTPLFTTKDKIKLFFEPFRKKGNNPYETIAELTSRRMGESFVDYAVNPFISGIYAGDPNKLVTKYAIPKLYSLEQEYGSFIKGAYHKSREKKTDYETKATKEVFSVKGGLSRLTEALENQIGTNQIICNAKNVEIIKDGKTYLLKYIQNGEEKKIETMHVISTVGSYALPQLLPFIPKADIKAACNLNYAKVIQVSVALKENVLHHKYTSFGGLIPQKENRKILGILFPGFCFEQRVPEGCSLLAVYMGGIRYPELYDFPDKKIYDIVLKEINELLDIPEEAIRFMKIFRHPYAIPQYEKTSGERLKTIQKIEKENPGLIIAGNIRDGIGMADRIKQAFDIARVFT